MKLVLSQLVEAKLKTWIDAAPGEVSGRGIIRVAPGEFQVEDIFLVEQSNTAASTEIDALALCKLVESVQDRVDYKTTFLKLHWHSHANMGVFWSGTDNELMDESCSHDWFIMLVANKKGEYLARYCAPRGLCLPTGDHALDLTLPVSVQDNFSDLRREWRRELEEKTKHPEPAPLAPYEKHFSDYHSKTYPHLHEDTDYPRDTGLLYDYDDFDEREDIDYPASQKSILDNFRGERKQSKKPHKRRGK